MGKFSYIRMAMLVLAPNIAISLCNSVNQRCRRLIYPDVAVTVFIWFCLPPWSSTNVFCRGTFSRGAYDITTFYFDHSDKWLLVFFLLHCCFVYFILTFKVLPLPYFTMFTPFWRLLSLRPFMS